MPASLTLAISIITSLLPLVKGGTQVYADLKAARDAINVAQAKCRDLTADEFAAFMAKADAAGTDLAALAAAAEAQVAQQWACPPSATVRQNGFIEDWRISSSS